MAWTNLQIGLAVLLVITGSLNTISTKWADMIESVNSAGVPAKFIHPYVQAASMFLGETSCLIVYQINYFISKRYKEEENQLLESNTKNFNRFILLIPAVLDMIATSLMYIGLTLTFASSFQMLRGFVIIFTGIMSLGFLGRKFFYFNWLGMFLILIGLSLVGASDYLTQGEITGHSKADTLTGILLIVLAQIFTSFQMVYEEKFLKQYHIPALQAVGWEGLFGFIILSVLMIPMYYIHVGSPFGNNPRGVLEDALDAFTQLGNSLWLPIAVTGTIISIAFFNFAGVSVTKELSATTRMVLDSIRTLIIWIVSLILKWQNFFYLQVIGFLLLVIGMMIYNDLVFRPTILKLYYKVKPSEEQHITSM